LPIDVLTNLNCEVITKIKNILSSENKAKEYNIFEEDSIFSPYLYSRGSK
jgi:hypothetical protein